MSFFETSITLCQSQAKTTRKLQTNILSDYTHTNPQQNTGKHNPSIFKDYISGTSEFYSRNARVAKQEDINQCNIHIIRMKVKTHIIISIDVE